MKKVRISWDKFYPVVRESAPMTEAEALALKEKAEERFMREALDIKVEIIDV